MHRSYLPESLRTFGMAVWVTATNYIVSRNRHAHCKHISIVCYFFFFVWPDFSLMPSSKNFQFYVSQAIHSNAIKILFESIKILQSHSIEWNIFLLTDIIRVVYHHFLLATVAAAAAGAAAATYRIHFMDAAIVKFRELSSKWNRVKNFRRWIVNWFHKKNQ